MAGGRSHGARADADRAPEVSPTLLETFARTSRRDLASHFHGIHLSKAQAAPQMPPDRPLVVYLNHPSWWDPLVCLEIALRLYPDRRHYGPMEATTLSRYGISDRLGFFAIEPGTARGARRFLDLSLAVLARPATALWVTPGGRFCDPRERPALRPGVGHLARRLKCGVLVPLALEYPFWDARFPEVLARFGEPVDAEDVGMRAADWTTLLAERLAEAQDRLAAEAQSRDLARFDTLLGGDAGMGDTAGTGGVHELWRRVKARFRGRRPGSGQGEAVP